MWVCQNYGYFFGAPKKRAIVHWGLYWSASILGNYQIAFLGEGFRKLCWQTSCRLGSISLRRVRASPGWLSKPNSLILLLSLRIWGRQLTSAVGKFHQAGFTSADQILMWDVRQLKASHTALYGYPTCL